MTLTSKYDDGRILLSASQKIEESRYKFLLLNPATQFSNIVKEARSVKLLFQIVLLRNVLFYFIQSSFTSRLLLLVVQCNRFLNFEINYFYQQVLLLTELWSFLVVMSSLPKIYYLFVYQKVLREKN